ncbi:hypothetical protein Cs7R123_54360 [Catellatospora sp. TT07R-123]|uniref:CATRA system-associated protein n=1 Tax=Catellatospora sp. TT07R-123 TaxID=2733863 RepID=UPI001B15E25A|nr:CATRA system-associated protein [Catellatospora sp. TT07R-123]GHJ48094.1 hypothetical protein Cs7R123_54360 [Catellatospora sp. TT07R-123]
MVSDEEVAELGELLREAAEWELAEARWEQVLALVEVIESALAARDADTVRQAWSDLELSGPVRLTRVGTTATVPPPKKVRDTLNRLVHTLGNGGAPDGGTSHR